MSYIDRRIPTRLRWALWGILLASPLSILLDTGGNPTADTSLFWVAGWFMTTLSALAVFALLLRYDVHPPVSNSNKGREKSIVWMATTPLHLTALFLLTSMFRYFLPSYVTNFIIFFCIVGQVSIVSSILRAAVDTALLEEQPSPVDYVPELTGPHKRIK